MFFFSLLLPSFNEYSIWIAFDENDGNDQTDNLALTSDFIRSIQKILKSYAYKRYRDVQKGWSEHDDTDLPRSNDEVHEIYAIQWNTFKIFSHPASLNLWYRFEKVSSGDYWKYSVCYYWRTLNRTNYMDTQFNMFTGSFTRWLCSNCVWYSVFKVFYDSYMVALTNFSDCVFISLVL